MENHSDINRKTKVVIITMSTSTPGPWQERWRQLKLAHCAIPNYGNSKEFWNSKKNVQTVYMKRMAEYQHQTDARLAAMNIPAGSRVLDIGAGHGTFAVPLAMKGCRVTVVEPSRVMREALDERMHQEHQPEIVIIPHRWEDVTPDDLGEPYDIVIASYSLTMMDIADAVAKMQECCRGTVHLFWFLTPPPWVKVNRDLWPLLHGGEFPDEPMADWLWQILIEMGIYANLVVEFPFPPSTFANADDATRDFLGRLNCTTPEQEEIVKNYFHSVLRQSGTGYVLGNETLGAHIWWNVNNRI